MNASSQPAAAFWIRVCDDASDPSAFAAFRAAFAAAKPSADATADRIAVKAEGETGPLAIEAAAPFTAPEKIEPAPKRAVFAIDGRDVGAEILGDVPGIAEYRAERERMAKAIAANRVPVSPSRAAQWEAEKGAVAHGMQIDDDRSAFGGKFVWAPGKAGGRGSVKGGAVSWQLDVRQAGTYRLWGRICAPTPDDDSFFVSACAGEFSPTRREIGRAHV